MFRLYTLILYLLVPYVLIRLYYLGTKNPEYRKRWSERFGITPSSGINRRIIWVHAVSVGEIQASKPLIEFLLSNFHQFQVLITTTTPTGAETASQLFGDSVLHRYFPYDLPFVVSRFLKIFNPILLIILETEIWPNLYQQCSDLEIPITLINARLSKRSLNGYNLLKKLTRQALECTSLIAAQSEEDADRFKLLGVSTEKVAVMGNLKFDIKLPHSIFEEAEVVRRLFSNRPVWIAASTHEGEEKIILTALGDILKSIPESLLVIAPRHPHRFERIVELCEKNGYETVLYSNSSQYSSDTQIFILDTLGRLPTYYGASDIAFVGGSLVPNGGHNMLEPACLGVPVITGSHLFNFREISTLLTEADALIKVANYSELAETVVRLLNDANLRFNMGERAKQVINKNQGAIEKISAAVTVYLQ